jgi:DnaJ-class molecular chaperone
LFGILVENGEDQVKCKDCGGEGSLPIHGSLKVCRACNGLGTVSAFSIVQRALRQFQQPANYTVSRGNSIVLKYSGRDDVVHALQALWLSGIKARIVFPI